MRATSSALVRRIGRLLSRRTVAVLLLVTTVFVLTTLLSANNRLALKCHLRPSLCQKKGPAFSPNPKHAAQAKIETAKLAQIKSLTKSEDPDRLALGHNFYKKILKVVVNARPKLSQPLDRYYLGKFSAMRFEYGKEDQSFAESDLQLFLQVSDEEERELRLSHKYVVDNLPSTAPQGLYSGNGIVFVGGGRFNWLTLLSIKRLRSMGCTLPIEVLIPTFEDFELDVCTSVFPSLQATCIYMPLALFKDEVSRYGENSQLTFKGYQYKCLAVMLSRFENVLLLDSDNIVINSPQNLFTSEPFKSKGLIVWPDFWRRSTCPKFYSIAGSKISTTRLSDAYLEQVNGYLEQTGKVTPYDAVNKISYHERLGTIPDPSSESGQMMISKKTHLKALLLAFYYNTFGPDFYYPLFSQGATGEGDKETFLAGAVILGDPFYQVGSFVQAIGEFIDGEFKGHGMGQADPRQDYERSIELKKLAKQYSDTQLFAKMKEYPRPKLMFLHANYPKLDPWDLSKGTTFDGISRHRLYGSALMEETGRDIELEIWNNIEELVCGTSTLKLSTLNKVERPVLCQEILMQKKYLIATTDSLRR